MALPEVDAFYLEGASGRLFCLLHQPGAGVPVRGALLYLAPFAEEMNKSRRMAALQARALAEHGWWVLKPDMHGCGDSEGDYASAAWSTWVADAQYMADYLAARSGMEPVLWGLRAGCLLAVATASARSTPQRLLLWQPVVSGKQHLQQFLRLKVAGAMLDAGREAADGTRQLREHLQKGVAVEVAGYTLAPSLALGMDGAELKAPPAGGLCAWLEAGSAAVPEIAPASRLAIGKWQAAGWQVDAQAVTGPAFWQTQEIEEAPALIEATLEALAGMPA